MIDGLLAGRIYGAPVARTSKNGNPFATAKLRVGTVDGETLFVNVIAFPRCAVEALLALSDGDSAALTGELNVGTYQDKAGSWRPSLDLKAHAVLSAYHVRRKRDAMSDSRAPAGGTEHEFNDSLEGVGA